MNAVAGLVLCGGTSRRMGRDKALLEVDGRPLVRVVAERLATVADPVLLAPGRPGRLGRTGYREVADAVPGAGPLGGLAGGLAASPSALMAVVAVDMPFASPAVFRVLISLRSDEDAVVPVTEAGPHPFHALYATSSLPAVRSALAAGRLRARELLGSIRVREVGRDEWGPADPDGRFALNLNRPEDAAALDWAMRAGPEGS